MESQGLLKKCVNVFLFLLFGLVHTGANVFSLAMPMMAILVGSETAFLLAAGEAGAGGKLAALTLGIAVLGFAAGALYRRLEGSTAWTRSKLSTIGFSAVAFATIFITAPFFVNQKLTPNVFVACLAGSGTALLAVWGITTFCRRLHGVSLLTVWKDGLQEMRGMFKKNSSGS